MAVIGGVAVVAIANGVTTDKRSTKAAIEKYKLTKYETGFMNQCKSAMGSYNVKFSKGAKRTEGCACVTSKLSKSLSQKRLKSAGDVLDVAYYFTQNKKKKKKRNYKTGLRKLERVQKKYKLSNAKFKLLLNTVVTSVNQCGKKPSQRS